MADRAEPEDPQGRASNATATAESERVFISYASADASVAHALVESLERHGIACWIAPRDVKAGALYAEAIVRAIGGARALVLVLSENAINSPHVGKEVERASSKRRPIITLRVDNAPLTPSLEYFLSESQWVEAQSGNMQGAYGRLIDAIQEPERTAPTTKPTVSPSVSTVPAVHPNGDRSRIVLTVALAAAVAVAGLLVNKLWQARRSLAAQSTAAATAVASDKSIAVLPFTDMSEKRDQGYFADGMAEEVLDLLAKLPGIKVIGRTSSFQFKGQGEDLRKIGNTLGAAYIVEGSVRRSGDRLRVTAQLIGVSDASHVWSESYDENVGDVLRVQDQIAAGIVRALQVAVGADELQSRPVLRNAEAYDFYQRGRHAMDRFDQTGFEAAAGFFQRALDLDPSSIRAAEWLAEAHESIAEWGFVPPRDGYQRARQSVERALALDPKSAMAHALMCTIHVIHDWDWGAAAQECTEALTLDPRNPMVLGEVANFQRSQGKLDEAARLLNTAFALDPLNAAYREQLGNIRYRAGRLAEAEAELRETLALCPTYVSGHYYLGQILLADGKFEHALSEMKQEVPDGGRDTGLAVVYRAMGQKAEAAALARLLRDHAGDTAYQIAQVYADRGESTQAMLWLNRAYDQKDVELYWIKGDPWLKKIDSDPRYKAFLVKLKLPA